MTLALLLTALAAGVLPAAGQQGERFKGRSLLDALRTLEAAGLRIVFTSATVTPDLRIDVEPRATAPRAQLDELLAPHRLVARSGPGGILQVVRAAARAPVPRPADGTVEGRVVNAFTAAPLSGVVIRVDGTRLEARSDSAGRFRLARVRLGCRNGRRRNAGVRAGTPDGARLGAQME